MRSEPNIEPRECHKMAKEMLEYDTFVEIPRKLRKILGEADMLAKTQDGKIKSRQIVALAISLYKNTCNVTPEFADKYEYRLQGRSQKQ